MSVTIFVLINLWNLALYFQIFTFGFSQVLITILDQVTEYGSNYSIAAALAFDNMHYPEPSSVPIRGAWYDLMCTIINYNQPSIPFSGVTELTLAKFGLFLWSAKMTLHLLASGLRLNASDRVSDPMLPF